MRCGAFNARQRPLEAWLCLLIGVTGIYLRIAIAADQDRPDLVVQPLADVLNEWRAAPFEKALVPVAGAPTRAPGQDQPGQRRRFFFPQRFLPTCGYGIIAVYHPRRDDTALHDRHTRH